MTTDGQRFESRERVHPLPKGAQLIRLADIYFKVALFVSFFLLPFVILLGATDAPLFISTLTLAAAIPSLALAITSTLIYGRMAKSSIVLGVTGTICCFIAITAMLWHISWAAGVIFLIVTLVGDGILASLD
jgi:hypothetical protein